MGSRVEDRVRRRARKLGYRLNKLRHSKASGTGGGYRLNTAALEQVVLGNNGGVPLAEIAAFLERRLRDRDHAARILAADKVVVDALVAVAREHGIDQPESEARKAHRAFRRRLDRIASAAIRVSRFREGGIEDKGAMKLDFAAKLAREAGCRLGIGVRKMSRAAAVAEAAAAEYGNLPPVQRRAADILAGKVKRVAARKNRDALRIVEHVRRDFDPSPPRRTGRPRGSATAAIRSPLPKGPSDGDWQWRYEPSKKDLVEAMIAALEIMTKKQRRELFPTVRVGSAEFRAVRACIYDGDDADDVEDDADGSNRIEKMEIIVARLIRASVKQPTEK